MVTRDTTWANGTPCWADLGVAEVAKAGAFYAALFDWEVRPGPPEAGGYAVCLKDGRRVAGIGSRAHRGTAGERAGVAGLEREPQQ
jgi:predicted enzyme related to lactoylglutathione lyase